MQTLSYSLWQERVGQTGWMKKEKGRKWERGPEMEWYKERKTCFLMSNATTANKQSKVNEMRLTEECFSVLFAQVVIARYCVECYWQGLAVTTEHLFCCIMHLKHNLLACLYNCVYAWCWLYSCDNTICQVNATEHKEPRPQTRVFFSGIVPVLNPHMPAPTVRKRWGQMSKILHCTLFKAKKFAVESDVNLRQHGLNVLHVFKKVLKSSMSPNAVRHVRHTTKTTTNIIKCTLSQPINKHITGTHTRFVHIHVCSL